MPTTVMPVGTSWMTTELAPTRAPLPTVMGPRIFAPAPTTTPSSRVGWRLPGFQETPPRVTPWDFGGLADHDAAAVVDEEAAADGGARVDVDLGEHAREETEEACGVAQSARPQGMADAMPEQGVDAGIGRDDLPCRARGRVAQEHAGHVLAQQGEQSRCAGGAEGWGVAVDHRGHGRFPSQDWICALGIASR